MAGGRIDIEVAADLGGFLNQFQDGMNSAGGVVDGLAGKLAALAAVTGAGLSFVSVIETGNEFQRTLNSLSGVTGAAADEMDRLKQKAMDLGNDTDLSATSANDAAAAMLELSKGGFSVEQSMDAAKGTLQLAAAAQIDAAEAATIQSQALQAFGLDADYAATASDVLANAANASSAEITDIASGLAQSGAVANQFGLSIEDTSATLGMLANAGITGSDAGTLLKSTLLSLTDTSKPAQGAMETLGLTVYDAQGQFVGMESLIGQLQTASQNLTPELYQQATATLLGSDAMRLGGVAAEQGAAGFLAMRSAVGEQGAAAELAAAQNQGLPGVFERIENTSERLRLQLYDLIDGPLTGLGTAVVDLADKGLDRFDTVVAAANESMGGLGTTMSGMALSDFPMLNAAWGNIVQSGQSLVNIGRDAGTALLDLGQGALTSGGLLDTLQAAGQGAAAGLSGTLSVAEPLVGMIGSLVGAFSELPGPVQTAALALVALRVAQSVFATQITAASGAVRGFTTNARNFVTSTGGVVTTTQRLGGAAQNAGVQMGRFGTSIATIGQRMPGVAAIQSSFVGAASSAALAGQSFARTTGAMAATGTAMKVAAGGLFSALGGPVGLAITATVVGLSLYAKSQREAAQAAAEHKAAVDNLVGTLDPETGAITQATIAAKAKALADNDMIDSAKNYGIAAGDFVGAHLNQAGALERVNAVIGENISKSTEQSNVYKSNRSDYDKIGVSLDDITRALTEGGSAYDDVQGKIDAYNSRMDAAGGSTKDHIADLDDLKGRLDQAGAGALDMADSINSSNQELSEAQQIQKDTALALDRGSQTAQDMAGALDTLGNSASTADQRVTAVKDALDALNGNSLSAEEAAARLNEAFDRTREALTGGIDGTAKPAFDQITGAIDTTTEAGRNLLDSLSAQRESMIGSAQAASDAAGKNGDLAAAQQAATDVVNRSRQSLVDQALQLGYNDVAAQALADRYLGIPGDITTLISQPNMAESQLALDILKDKVDLVPGDKAITVETLDQDAITKLEALGFKVTTLPNGQVKVEALTDPARTAIDQLVNQPRTVSVNFAIENPGAVTAAVREAEAATGRRVNRGAYAEGGEIPSNVGIPGVDSVPAMLMPGEHVFDTRDVALMGGQQGVYRFREALNAGKIRGFADGGAVDGLDNMINFARSNAGRGYVWGDWDCSMFMSQIAAAGMGRSLGRLWTTYSILGGDLQGMQPGGDQGHFRIGVSQEHMAGTLFGRDGSRLADVENGGSNGGSTFGSGAAGYDDPQFSSQFYLPDSMLNPAIVAGLTSGMGVEDPMAVAKRDAAIQSATAALAKAQETRDETYANEKKSDADRQVADAKVREAELKLEEARTATVTSDTESKLPAPQAAEVGSFTDDEISKMRAQIAVDEANARRNEVYADPESTENDKREADFALIEARNKQKDAGSLSTTAGGSSSPFTVKDRLKQFGSDLAGIVVDAAFEQLPFGLGESRWLTTDFAAFAPKPTRPEPSFTEAEVNDQLPVTPGAPGWEQNLADTDGDWMRKVGDELLRRLGVNPVVNLRDTGGRLPHNGLALNLSGQDEWITTAAQRDADMRAVAAARASNQAPTLDVSQMTAALERTTSSSPDFSIHIGEVRGHDINEVARHMTGLQQRQMMRYGGRP